MYLMYILLIGLIVLWFFVRIKRKEAREATVASLEQALGGKASVTSGRSDIRSFTIHGRYKSKEVTLSVNYGNWYDTEWDVESVRSVVVWVKLTDEQMLRHGKVKGRVSFFSAIKAIIKGKPITKLEFDCLKAERLFFLAPGQDDVIKVINDSIEATKLL